MIGNKFASKIASGLAAISLLLNTFATPAIVLAQEVTPTPEPTSEVMVLPEATVEPTVEPSPSIEPIVELIASPEASVEPTSSAEPTTSSEPSATPQVALVETQSGEITTTVLESVDFSSVTQLDGSSTITTDKADYAPTETVVISGSDLEANTTYTLVVSSEDDPAVRFETQVTTDASGSFVYLYQLDGNYRPNYLIEIFLGSLLVASATFTDGQESASLEQCRNGASDSPNNCVVLGGGAGWQNGNAGSENSHYIEGFSIPYRTIMKNLPTDGTVITLDLGYDIKNSGHHAIDYLTHYDRLQLHTPFGHSAETITPTDGVSGISGTTTTFAIPTPDSTGSPVAGQPATSFNALPAGERVMTLFGGTISNVSYLSQGNLTASQSETIVRVTFTVDSSTAVLAWGGHIASRLDWGFDNGDPRSAGGINGSSYHMRLEDWSLGNLGNTDRSLSTGAVIPPGNLTIIKEIVPPDSSLWDFQVTGPNSYSNNIQDLSDGGQSILNVAPGEYTITETTDPNYTPSVLCNTLESGTTSVIVDISSSESVICTFTNTLNTGNITVVKNVDNNNDGDVTDQGDVQGATDWTWDIQNGEQNIATGQTRTLISGNYTLSEDSQLGYHLIGWSCTNQTSGSTNSIPLTLPTGGNITCTFTNAADTGSLTLIKNDANNINPQDWTFDVDGPSTNDFNDVASGTTLTNLPLGTYTVTEAGPLNYHFVFGSGTGCSFDQSGTLIVTITQNGGTFTCTYENAPDNGSISGTKYHDKDASGSFTLGDTILDGWEIFLDDGDGIWEDGEAKVTTANSGTYSFDLAPDSYNVCEVLQNGWTNTAPICHQGVNVGPGQPVTHQDFYNFQNIKISGYKFEDMNGDGVWDQGELPLDGWTVNLTGSASASAVTGTGDWPDGYYEFTDLGPGSYNVFEDLVSLDWFQTAGDNPYLISAVGGQNIPDINFGNFEFARIWGYKYNDLNASGDLDIETIADRLDDWTINLTGQTSVITGNGTWVDGYYEFTGLTAGDYTLSETLSLAGWFQSIPLGGDYQFTIQSGDVLQFDFANWTQGQLVVCKRDDAGAPVTGWEMTVDGENLDEPVSQDTEDNGCTTFDLDPGNYSVTEELQTNWTPQGDVSIGRIVVQSNHTTGPIYFVNARPANLTIEKFNDLNGNQIDDTEPRLEGWHFSVYEDTCEQKGNLIFGGTTNSSGQINTQLPSGNYCVVEDDLGNQTGWVNTTGLEVGINLTPNESETVYFGNFQLGEISGKKFNDLDGDHVRTNTITDPNLPGWTIRLDLVGSGASPDCPEGAINGEYCEDVTNASGNYLFSGLAAGTYIVSEVILQPGWVQTRPNETYGGQGAQANGTYLLTINSGDVIDDRDFGNQGRGSIVVVKDVQPDDDSEWDFNIQGPNLSEGFVLGDGDDTGSDYADLPAGEYTVFETIDEDHYATRVSCTNDAGGGDSVTFDLNAGDQVVCTFVNAGRSGEILGTKWNDLDGDGERDEGEPGLEDWTIWLFETYGEEFGEDQSDLTDENGDYQFGELEPGVTYLICEQLQLGWMQTYPEEGENTGIVPDFGRCHYVHVGPGETVEDVDFGNQEIVVDLVIEKSNDRPNANKGDTVTYTLTVTNNGNQTVDDLIVKDVLPGGFTYVAGTTLIYGDPTIAGGVLSWNVGSLHPGESVEVVYQAKIASDVADGTYTNLATCTGFINKLEEERDCNVDDSSVRIGTNPSFGGNLNPQVLGASTELPASGSRTEILVFAVTMIGLGVTAKVLRRKYAQN